MRIRLMLLTLLIATPALAKPRHTPGVQDDEIDRPSEVEPSVATGNLLPWSIGANHERRGILLSSYGGFDQAKRTPVMIGALDATFVERITLRATVANTGMSNVLQPAFGVLVDVVREADRGVDFALGGDYDVRGWNNMPAVVTRTALGTTVGLLRLQTNAGVGIGLEGGERYGDLRLSGLHPVGGQIYAGLDSRARIDLERNDPEPAGELDWDMQAGPIATLALGRFAVSATGGVSAWKLRSGENAKLGAVGALGVGAAF